MTCPIKMKMKPVISQDILVMTYSPIMGVNYELKTVNVDTLVNEWEPEEGEYIHE